MEKEDIENLISRYEREINQIKEFSTFLGEEHIEKQIDIRLEALSKLYKKRKQKEN